jgi:hypothetical protein
MAEYSSTFGIQFAIDIINVPPENVSYYYFCTVCHFPPATFYNKGDADLDFFYKVDLANSLTQELLLRDDPVNYFPQYDPSHVLIIELNRVRLGSSGSPESGVETVGYTVLSLFDLQEQVVCANVGIREISLVEGEFDEREIKNMQGNMIRFLELEEPKKKSGFVIAARIMNGFFPNQLSRPEMGSKGKPLRTIFQNSKGFKTTQEGIKKIIEDTYGVNLQ